MRTIKENNHDPVQFFARIMALIPTLLLRSGTAWLSFKRQAKKGGKTFQKELLKQGLDKETAALFTKQYISSSNLIRNILDQS